MLGNPRCRQHRPCWHEALLPGWLRASGCVHGCTSASGIAHDKGSSCWERREPESESPSTTMATHQSIPHPTKFGGAVTPIRPTSAPRDGSARWQRHPGWREHQCDDSTWNTQGAVILDPYGHTRGGLASLSGEHRRIRATIHGVTLAHLQTDRHVATAATHELGGHRFWRWRGAPDTIAHPPTISPAPERKLAPAIKTGPALGLPGAPRARACPDKHRRECCNRLSCLARGRRRRLLVDLRARLRHSRRPFV